MQVTHKNISRLPFLRDEDMSRFILALHTPEDETQGLEPFTVFFSFRLRLFCHIIWITPNLCFSGRCVLARQMVAHW